MAERIKLAVNWAGACGGCDVSLLDSEEQILELAEVADIVYWPVAMDFKRADLQAFAPGAIDVGLFNGAIRTSEHADDARLMRSRCRLLVAYGSCAAFGGIPGLANLHGSDELFDTVYRDTASTVNPDGVLPGTATDIEGHTLELPEITATVRALHQVVDVDVTVPGCPPPPAKVAEALDLIIAVGRGAELPGPGTVLASNKALCDECDRVETRTDGRVGTIHRTHEFAADPETCFLEQGVLCMGIATRGGCGSTCIEVNSPCRGCFGPTAEMLDPAAEALSTIGSIIGPEQEDELPANRRLLAARSIRDLAGTCYRFTLPVAAIPRALRDGSEE
jgi:F420-non-reducing hydrogenase small subunit